MSRLIVIWHFLYGLVWLYSGTTQLSEALVIILGVIQHARSALLGPNHQSFCWPTLWTQPSSGPFSERTAESEGGFITQKFQRGSCQACLHILTTYVSSVHNIIVFHCQSSDFSVSWGASPPQPMLAVWPWEIRWNSLSPSFCIWNVGLVLVHDLQSYCIEWKSPHHPYQGYDKVSSTW